VTLLFCGIDWAETHGDVAIIDESGRLVAKKRIPDDPSGFAQLVELLAEAGDCAEHPVPVAIEDPTRTARCVAVGNRPAGVMRSTHCRWPGIGNAARWHGRIPITLTR
jgi:predicted NBD/HSP70 family sugar kinase